jgi:hypothetical protein
LDTDIAARNVDIFAREQRIGERQSALVKEKDPYKRLVLQEQIQKSQNINRHDQVANVEDQQQKGLLSYKSLADGAELRNVLKELQSSYKDEELKRRELNASLEQSATAVKNFGDKTREAGDGHQVSLLRKAIAIQGATGYSPAQSFTFTRRQTANRSRCSIWYLSAKNCITTGAACRT